MNTTPLLSLIAAFVALTVVTYAQGPAVKYLVSIHATATDSAGLEVADLRDDELIVGADGEPVTIASMSRQTHPVSMIVLLDTSASLGRKAEMMRLVAMGFLSQVRPIDRARVGGFSGTIQFSDAFVADQDALMSALGTLEGGNPTRLHDAMLACANLLKDEPGRRAIVVMSDGDDTSSKTSLGDAVEVLQSHQIAVYSIGVEAVFHNGSRLVQVRPRRELVRYAEETGGAYFELTSRIDLKAEVLRSIQEMRTSYVITFAPTKVDGKHHRLLVQSSRRGVTIRAARGYFARP